MRTIQYTLALTLLLSYQRSLATSSPCKFLEVFSAPPDSVEYQTSILDLSNKGLKSLPVDIGKYKDLEELDLSGNPIEKLDSSIFSLKKLRSIKLNYCTSMNTFLVAKTINKTNIEEVEMNYSSLVYIPSGFCWNKKLRRLSLKGNRIDYFPPELGLYSRLRQLDLSGNDIDTLPREFEAMKWLKVLDLSNNTCLQNSGSCLRIAELRNLTDLRVDSIASLPAEFEHLQHLRKLTISNSSFKNFPSNLSNLEELTIENCPNIDYTMLFSSLASCDKLKSLELSSDKLTEIPATIINLKHLNKLTIAGNGLNSLPPNFDKLDELETLIIRLPADKQNVQRVMREIAGCSSLKSLDLSFSRCDEFPALSSGLHNLRRLSFEGVLLQKLPQGISALKQLEELDLRGTTIPELAVNDLQQKLVTCTILYDRDFEPSSVLTKELYSSAERFEMEASVAVTFSTSDGSNIRVPANAFVDSKGKPVKGNVTISYKPFYSPAEIYLSGINMNYDSAGTRYSFVSAGMFSISATANNEQLSLAKGKLVGIDFKSLDPSRNYNVYRYDERSRNWEFKGSDTTVTVPANETLVNTRPAVPLDMPLRPIRPERPVFGQLATNIDYEMVSSRPRKTYKFRIKRGYDSYQEVRDSAGKRVRLRDEIDAFFPAHSPWILEADSVGPNIFDSRNSAARPMFTSEQVGKKSRKKRFRRADGDTRIDITPNKETDRFRLTIHTPYDSIVFYAYPSTRQHSASRIQAEVKRRYQHFLAEKKLRESHEEGIMRQYREKLESYDGDMEAYREKTKLIEDNFDNLQTSAETLQRSLMISGMGTWNCDHPFPLPNSQDVLANLYLNGRHIRPRSLTVINVNANLYGTYYTSQFKVARHALNTVIIQLKDDQFAFAKFRVTDRNTRTVDLALKTIETKDMRIADFTKAVFN